jgi:acid phosphatase type 7
VKAGEAKMRPRMFALAVAVCTAVALEGAAAPQTPQAVAIGPYVQNVGTDSATVCWATVSGEVALAPAAARGDSSFREYEVHSVQLRNLSPGTTYTYRVPGDGGEAGRCTFSTVPAGDRSFAFAVISDTQNRDNRAHRPLVERIMAGRPDLFFSVGDLVSDGRNLGDWEEFFRVEGELLRGVPLYAVLGNHERSASHYFRFFALPGNERYY